MSFIREVLVLLWFAVCAKAACTNYTVCVAIQNASEAECQHHHPIVYKLTDITVNQTSCKSVHIYLTSGTHILNKSVLYIENSVQETEIRGAPHGQPSIIECWNNSGIRFSENENANTLLITNIMFLHCHTTFSPPLFMVAALYLQNAMYTLSGVTIMMNTDGRSLFSYNCRQQIITNCTFSSNKNYIYISLENYNSSISIAHSTFKSDVAISCRLIDMHVSIVLQNSTFSGAVLFLKNSCTCNAEITGCLFENNKKFAIKVISSSCTIVISKGTFQKNVEDIFLGENKNQVIVRECNFTNHNGFPAIEAFGVNSLEHEDFSVVLEKSTFQGSKRISHGFHCSVLNIGSIQNFTLSDVSIADYNCTGISIKNSVIYIRNTVNLTKNHGFLGGGLHIEHSNILFEKSSKLSLTNNTADTYGGGIYYVGEERCSNYHECFFNQFEENITSEMIVFSGNSARRGGDAVFGGCLSGCYDLNYIFRSKCYQNTTFWDLVCSTNIVSPSTFVDNQRRVMFCTNTSENTSTPGASCKDTDSISVYRGQIFTVQLMVADECCIPSAEAIEAKVIHSGNQGKSLLRFKHDTIQQGKKYCDKFNYTLVGGSWQEETTVNVTFSLLQLIHSHLAELRVHLKDCPTGYEIESESGECGCRSILKSYKITCHPSEFSLQIPAHTWVGELEKVSESIAMQNDCQYCKSEEVQLIITRGSHPLCISNRAGVMCGACVANYSLQLGGYECADCSNSTHKGILLLITFAVIGIALVLLLLILNLTVSTGMINGLIFYSNIVYLNSDTLLPINRDGNSTHLQNTVRILSTFQAWMNLDFGIVTCFFDGYNTYISIWMQFVFPFYLWLLMVIIVLASRYSSRISKITTSNTVSVLATLLLLSYAKLLKTSIEAFSSVQLQLLNGNMTHKLWKTDANIPYLGQLHLPLFLIGLVIVIVYIIPFTLLILLGPILQAKSHYRILHWINKLKPFYDAFYGPYTSRYRYWPGILLSSRFCIMVTFTFYSPNDILLKLLTVSMITTGLLVSWMVIGKINAVSINRKKVLNYLELFLLINLSAFANLSFYTSSGTAKEGQQGLAVAMVGSALALFCGIVGYHILLTFSMCSKFVPANIFKRKNTLGRPPQKLEEVKSTHSLVEITECSTPNDQLREPLLTSDIHES